MIHVAGTGIALMLVAAAGVGWDRTATAQTPTGTPTVIADLGLVFDQVVGTVGDDPRITWTTTPQVDHFELTGTLNAVRVNKADPFCSPPIEAQGTTLTVNETLAGTAMGFRVPFPPLPPEDAWFVSVAEIRLRAFDANGVELGADGGGAVAEAICAGQASTSTPASEPVLPSTGAGDGEGAAVRTTAFFLVGGALLVLAGLIFAMRRQPVA